MFGFEVEFFYAVPANDNDARLFSVRRIDKHFLCHLSCAPRRTRATVKGRIPGGDHPDCSRCSPDVNIPEGSVRTFSSQTATGALASRGLFTSDRYCCDNVAYQTRMPMY